MTEPTTPGWDGGYPLGAIHLSPADVYRLLGVKPATLRRWVARGQVVKAKRGAYDMGSIMAFMERTGQRVPANALRLAS